MPYIAENNSKNLRDYAITIEQVRLWSGIVRHELENIDFSRVEKGQYVQSYKEEDKSFALYLAVVLTLYDRARPMVGASNEIPDIAGDFFNVSELETTPELLKKYDAGIIPIRAKSENAKKTMAVQSLADLVVLATIAAEAMQEDALKIDEIEFPMAQALKTESYKLDKLHEDKVQAYASVLNAFNGGVSDKRIDNFVANMNVTLSSAQADNDEALLSPLHEGEDYALC